jgi:DNA-directed RNA polymerase subunit RPC12/RpoP
MTNYDEAQTVAAFECPECGHEWTGATHPGRHDWETCPACGADDGANCWDCGESMEDDVGDASMCTDCRKTICWDCTGGMRRNFYSPHWDGREDDGGECGDTRRVY